MFLMTEDPDRMRMQRIANLHEAQGFLQSLNREQLDTLLMLFMSMTSEEGHLIAAQYHGMITQILSTKFNRCVCGNDHESAEDLLVEANNSHTGHAPEEHSTQGVLQMPTATESVDAGQSADVLMKIYRLELVSGKIVCTGCGLEYVSLTDRMLKDPDNCHGCHMKSAQG